MDPMAAIKQTFFQECEEQLAELESGLLAIEGGDRRSRDRQRGVSRGAFDQGRRRRVQPRRPGALRACVRDGARPRSRRPRRGRSGRSEDHAARSRRAGRPGARGARRHRGRRPPAVWHWRRNCAASVRRRRRRGRRRSRRPRLPARPGLLRRSRRSADARSADRSVAEAALHHQFRPQPEPLCQGQRIGAGPARARAARRRESPATRPTCRCSTELDPEGAYLAWTIELDDRAGRGGDPRSVRIRRLGLRPRDRFGVG